MGTSEHWKSGRACTWTSTRWGGASPWSCWTLASTAIERSWKLTPAQPLPPAEFDAIMHEVGRQAMLGRAAAPRGGLRDRVVTASALLNDLGGLSEVDEENGFYIIRSHGCPLAAATAEHPEVCNALESMLSEFVGAKVTKCCDRYDRVAAASRWRAIPLPQPSSDTDEHFRLSPFPSPWTRGDLKGG